MKIKEIFDKVSELEQHTFEINKLYTPVVRFQVKNQNNEFVNVVGMIIKKDNILKITTNSQELKTGSKHIIQLSNGDLKFCNNLKIGDLLRNINGDEEIISIEDLGKDIVYDITVDTDEHLYLDSSGFIHHNTYNVKQNLKGTNVEFATGALTSGSALYKFLFTNNDSDKIVVFDDLDSLLEDRDCVNMLKGALDSGDNTEISYISNNTVPPYFYDIIKEYETTDEIPEKAKEKLLSLKIDVESISEKMWEIYRNRASSPHRGNALMPNKFNFEGRVIFISNKYLKDIPGPLKSRAMTIEISLSLEEIVKRIKKVMPNIEVKGASDKHKSAALSFLQDTVIPSGRIQKVDFRSFMNIVKFAMSDAPKDIWHRWAASELMAKYGDKGGKKR